MVITEGDDYKYLGVMVSNLRVVQTSGVMMGGEAIVRKHKFKLWWQVMR